MKEYIYLWVDKCKPLNDMGGKDGFLFENQGFSLSTKYNVKHLLKRKTISFEINELDSTIPQGFFSDSILDLKAFVGQNGSGKTTFMKLFYQIISKGWGDILENPCNYILIYQENECFYFTSNKRLTTNSGLFFDKNKCLKPLFSINLLDGDQSRISYRNLNDSKACCSVFYTGSVNDAFLKQPYNEDCFDISTNALLYNDKERISNGAQNKQICDYYTSYVIMEMIRKISFATIFYDDFIGGKETSFRIPNVIILATEFYDNEYALDDIASVYKPLCLCLKKMLKNIEEKDDFYDKFRYSALVNRFRGLCTNSFSKNRAKRLFKMLSGLSQQTIESYLNCMKENWFTEERDQDDVETLIEILKKIESDEVVLYEKFRKNRPTLKKVDGFYFDLNKKNHRKFLTNFVEAYQKVIKVTPFITLQWRPQSSGEENFIKFYSRFHDVLTASNCHGERGIHVFLDEVDLYMHPEWQRQWISTFVNIMEIVLRKVYPNPPKLQVYLSTHSPFVITDLFKENIVLLSNADRKGTAMTVNNHDLSPFGANMYDLLSEDEGAFFIKNTIGSFSERKIQEAVEYKRNHPNEKNEVIDFTLKRIGDPIIGSLIDGWRTDK